MIMDIIKAPHRILNYECVPINIDNDAKILSRNMVETMLAKRGQGLAAPQVGVGVRMFVMRFGGIIETFYNPLITRKGNQMVSDIEGCLSIPGKRVTVRRPKLIEVQWTDRYGDLKKAKLRGMDARCFQHELDHLNGILIA